MRLTNLILRSGGFLVHLGWAIAVVVMALAWFDGFEASQLVLAAGIAAALLPAVFGILYARRSADRFPRLLLTLMWVGLAAACAVMTGGVLGPAAWAFLLPVAAIASFGGRGAIIEAAALSGATSILLLGLQLLGLLPVISVGADMILAGSFAAAWFVATGFAFAAIRSVRQTVRHGRLVRKHLAQSQAFENAPLPILVSKDGNILAASKATRDMLPGLPPHLHGLPLSDLAFSEQDRAYFDAGFATASNTVEIRGASGNAKGVQIFHTPSGVTALVPSNSDAASVKVQRQLTEERDQARLEAKAKSEFLASVSHEIRTPLNAIIGFSDAMKSRLFGPVPAKYAEYAELIHESGRHLHELIGDVLDLSKIEAESYELSLERFNARDVIELCVRMLSQRADDAKVSVELAVEDDLPVKADRKALRQILLNLLSNAIKFTPAAGVIVVMAKVEGQRLSLAVGDSGPGIPEAELEMLGQRYVQASTAQGTTERGSGLGLSLVKALAEMHGGEMRLASKVGEGTTVSVSMPVIHKEASAGDAAEPLEIHTRIERAQTAGQSIVSASSR
ncbi:ATP-binding protein [Hyphobacterium sp.]|uniref:sensor histidine kinase n=1 Tax=Hyphobacterium sp. TaxID=2004662 RepID=UPI003BAB12A4